MKKLALALVLALGLSGCAGLQQLTTAYSVVVTATVPAGDVVIAANAFDALKATATNYGRYCIQQRFVPVICSTDIRRVVVKAVRSGTAARNQLEASINTNQPAVASVYNALIAAVNALKTTPIETVKGS